MPVIDNPDLNHPMRKIAIFRKKNGKRARLLQEDRFAAEHVLVRECGPMSAPDLPAMSVHTVIALWLEQEPARGTKNVSLAESGRLLKSLLAPYLDRAFGSLAVDDFNAIMDGLAQRGETDPTRHALTERTIYGQGKLLEQFVGEAKRQGFIHFNPAAVANLTLPKLRPAAGRPFYPSESERNRIRMASNPVVLAIADLAIEAGGNTGKMVNLLREDCDFRAMTIKWRGKTSRVDPRGEILAHTLDMTPRLAASLIRHRLFSPEPRDCTNVFVTQKGKPLHYTAPGQLLRMTQVKINMLHRSGLVSGRSGRPDRRGTVGKERKSPLGKYDIDSLGHVAAIRWAGDNGLRIVADRMGHAVKRADELYKYLYEKQKGFDWVLENARKNA